MNRRDAESAETAGFWSKPGADKRDRREYSLAHVATATVDSSWRLFFVCALCASAV